jgi:hypothetical protein
MASQVQYKYNIGDKVRYMGGIHPSHHRKTGTITKRLCKGHRIDYSVLMDDSEIELTCIIERALENAVYIIDDIEESLEVNDENIRAVRRTSFDEN